MKKLLGFLLFFVLCFSPLQAEVAEQLPPLPQGPLILTSVQPQQLDANYWIGRLPEPDRLIKTPEELQSFNDYIRAMVKDQRDVLTMESSRSGQPVREQMELEFNATRNRLLYDIYDNRIPSSLFDREIKPVMNINAVPERINMTFGVAVRQASVRALPSDRKMLEKLRDFEFDQLQYTRLKLWTPVAIYHESSDGQWYYIQAPYIRGWVKARDIALVKNRNELKRYLKSGQFLVVTGESIPIYFDSSLQRRIEQPSMGTILPLAGPPAGEAGQLPQAYEVWIPVYDSKGYFVAKKAYVDIKSDVSVGFLPYTQRNVINQAFKLLGARYGWGGTYYGRDCSGFTQDVFLTVGLEMPRSSKNQGFVGTQLSHFKPFTHDDAKIKFLKEATPGITLLRMPHHQMIYLGEENGNFYVIHSTWAERISYTSDEKNRINQVVVSDLNLNGHSRIGSLFHRIISMNELQ